ncbi:bacterial regulatory s, tetR family protein [Yersinia pseudotuberculosis IP 32953]|uniref:Putative TetR-family regulatory protein n=1 Tax=Yersinia pseudotuberculosis serotype I (strain IP32953) TaxID=273123 RepID=Q66FZ0_YERPS|nr:TetR/AcrR family transcriptional regulator [Yersinia pseudotuberculosis]CQD58514.1 TetR family transcriptional regulator [Yersinia intermedia]AJJ02828.1 bacterial regulatory s, tetR family protein [Yersinia pseudotuberculosis]AJJ53818.1 bacterial regulatory s, tetR family protein [Yersinia pseudotuberculosis IP 32953]AJJ67464.1 bacterial regulatory s, tetR family protein [Yersinia pseudotuberculosis PB1/+]AYX16123.1 TetR/AcrR family transcriptional regulator [Yersinia pseudotuberculosis]
MNTQNKQEGFSPSLTTIRARTRRLLIDTAMSMYERGAFPSITEVASAAQLSRATAYRYFPTQSALVSAMVDESLGPILAWQPTQPDARQRIAELLSFAYPRMLQHEGVLRAALHLSLQQWADARSSDSNNSSNEEKLIRGNRKRLLKLAVEPLEETLAPEALQRVIHAFSLIYGSEVFMVLKDIWHLDEAGIQDVTQWMGKAILLQAETDSQLAAQDKTHS